MTEIDVWDVTFGEVRKIVRLHESWEAAIQHVVNLPQRYAALFNYPDYWDRVQEHDFSYSFEMVIRWAQDGLNALNASTGWEYLLLDLGDCPDGFHLYRPGGQSLMSEDKLRGVLSADVAFGATQLEECLAREHEYPFAILFGADRITLIHDGVSDIEDEILSANLMDDCGDYRYLLWFAIGSQALLRPLRDPADCRRILQGRDKMYLLSGFEEVFTYLATVTPEGLIYEYTNLPHGSPPIIKSQLSGNGNLLQGVLRFEQPDPYGWEPFVSMTEPKDDKDVLLTAETCHPKAAELLKEPFFFDCTDEFSPHGNDTGADTLSFYRKWRPENPDTPPVVFLDELLASWGCMNAHWDSVDSVEIQRLIRKDEFGLLVRDDTIIGLAFAQIVVEGVVDEDIKRRALTAIKRQALPVMIEFRDWTLPRQRLEKLAAMRAALEAV